MQMQLVHKIGLKYLYSSPTKFLEVNRQLSLFPPLAGMLKWTGILTDVHIQGEPNFLSTSGQAGGGRQKWTLWPGASFYERSPVWILLLHRADL